MLVHKIENVECVSSDTLGNYLYSVHRILQNVTYLVFWCVSSTDQGWGELVAVGVWNLYSYCDKIFYSPAQADSQKDVELTGLPFVSFRCQLYTKSSFVKEGRSVFHQYLISWIELDTSQIYAKYVLLLWMPVHCYVGINISSLLCLLIQVNGINCIISDYAFIVHLYEKVYYNKNIYSYYIRVIIDT